MLRLTLNPDEQLLKRIKSNDRAVLGELFVRHKKMVLKYVSGNGGDASDADDMLQEAIVVLWQNVCGGQFQLTSKIGTYLLGIVKNKWRAELRKRSRLVAGEPLELLASDGASSLDNLIHNEHTELVRRAVQRLDSVCRELLLLFYFEERSTKDIARIMSFANPDVVKAKKYQCKKRLQAALSSILAQE